MKAVNACRADVLRLRANRSFSPIDLDLEKKLDLEEHKIENLFQYLNENLVLEINRETDVK